MALVELKSNLSWYKNPPAVNYIPNETAGAKGFTVKMNTAPGLEKSQFTGIKNETYQFPITKTDFNSWRGDGIDLQLFTERGISTYGGKLVAGSPLFGNLGFSSKKPYAVEVVAQNSSDAGGDTPYIGFLANLYRRKNSPSLLDQQYAKWNLRDESVNYSYIQHPLILRGIQRKEKFEPQRWGIDALANFDDGLIRGGVTTAAERAAFDVVRIGKWLASPRGLLWIVKQVGLGFTNPKVEVIGGPLTRFNRIHAGIPAIASVAGTAFGLHFTRHGIPFVNEVGDYENVMKVKQSSLVYSENTILPTANRLMQLRNDVFFTSKVLNPSGNTYIQTFPRTLKGLPLMEISSTLGGAQSVYGIGPTFINRKVDTRTDAQAQAEKSNFLIKYGINQQYAGIISKAFNKTDILNNRSLQDIEKAGLSGRLKEIYDDNSQITPGGNKSSNISTQVSRDNGAYKNNTADATDSIRNYLTLAYSQIPKDKKSIRDFRKIIDDNLKTKNTSDAGIIGNGSVDSYYENFNLEKKYGFGTQGKPGADRSNPNNFFILPDKFNGSNRRVLVSDPDFRGDKITALDIGTAQRGFGDDKVYGKDERDLIEFYFEDGEKQGTNVMVFRCTMTGFSDSFSPGWNRIDIMGRPDGAYLYSSFERTISFNFIAAATTRSEMIPMWRKINYLASYTMPDLSGNRPSGPFMRITIGNLFQQTPGFITSLTYSIPEDATWDIAEDFDEDANGIPKQLPMMVEVTVSMTIVGDYRPQQLGRVYSLSTGGKLGDDSNWLSDART